MKGLFSYEQKFYINGSAAPARIIDEPVRNPRRTAPLTKEQIRKRQVDRYAEANRERAVRFGRLYTLFIAVAVAVTMAASVGFIKEYNRNTANNNKIKTLSEQLSKAKEANDLKKLTIDTSIDLTIYIRQQLRNLVWCMRVRIRL